MSDNILGTLTSLFGLMFVGAAVKTTFDMFGNMKNNANFFDWKLK